MKKFSAKEIRNIWLDFFKSKGHSIEESSPLVPINDPSLLWINAGVAPLKKYFDGSEQPRNPRICNAQKCIRTNDIENVGKTARHHTFFEMLGNFSIGDYFKEEAIEFGFEILTKHFLFPLDKLYMTYYPSDLTAKNKWMSLGVNEDHLIPLEGNFWEIGEGPCGPDTEIFFDRGEKYDKRGKELLENDIENDRFIEIWNIVFSQYNSKEGLSRDEYPELPNKNIDTGMGLERMACVLQGVDTNYETDLFLPYINRIEEISGVKYEGQMAFKVCADHIRTLTFAISDGAILSNEGRGYVLRRVLRRACKHARKLGITEPFLYKIVDDVVENMKDFYPYLVEKADIVKNIVKKEEEKFLETLASGEKRIYEIIKSGVNEISGADAFMLYDTYGFPYELTLEYALDNNITVDEEGFKKCMEHQRNTSRNARGDVDGMKAQNEEYMRFTAPSKFVGYDKLSVDTKVIKVFEAGVVLEETPFYATSGGQLCDKGFIDDYEVLDVIKLPNGQFLHILDDFVLNEGDQVTAKVMVDNRADITKNHSCAHLVHKSLKLVLGDHVHQQGSQISKDEMRFDFNNYSNLTDEEILKVEELVNEHIKAAHEVITKEMPIEEAKKTGAEALFGEKYHDVVRVVNMEYSIEFCGGTHVKNTSDIKEFAVSGVESIGSGLFRITGVSGDNALEKLLNSLGNIKQEINTIIEKGNRIVEEAFKDGIELSFNYETKKYTKASYQIVIDTRKELEVLKEMVKNLEKDYRRKKQEKELNNLSIYDEYILDGKLICVVEDKDVDTIKALADALLNKMGKGLVFIASINDDKVVFVCKNNIGAHAGKLVKEAAMITGGNGGGRPDMASAGGKDITKVSEALNVVRGLL